MQVQPLQQRPLIVLQLCLMVLIGRVAFDIYIPALPEISKQFQSQGDQISLTMSLFSLGFGVAQLFYGPLSDYFGRRYVVVIGFLIFIAGALWATLVDSIVQLYWARFVIGCGAGAGVVISRAIARDLFVENALARVSAIQSLILTLGLFIAPIVGGYLLNWFGWRSQFLTLTIFGIICLTLFLYHLPETNQFIKSSARSINPFGQYARILRDKQFMVYATIVGLSFSGLVCYFQLSTFIFQKQYNVSAISYGWLSLVIVLAYVLGTVGLRQDLKTKTLFQIVNKGTLYMLTASIILLGFCFFQWAVPAIILFATMLYVYGLRLIMPSCTSICLSHYAKQAGSASALLGAMIMLISAIVSAVLGFITTHSAIVLGVSYFVLGSVSWGVLKFFKCWGDR